MSKWLTVREAATHINRAPEVILSAVHADRDNARHLRAMRDPESTRGMIVLESDLDAWVNRNYEEVTS